MTATNAYDIKGALLDLLAANTTALAAATSRPDDPVQVEYSMPTRYLELRCIYGGSVRFSHIDDVAEQNVLIREEALVAVYFRVASRPARTAREDDSDVKALTSATLALVKAASSLSGPTRWLGVSGGLGVAGAAGTGSGSASAKTDTESVSVLGLQFRFGSRLAY